MGGGGGGPSTSGPVYEKWGGNSLQVRGGGGHSLRDRYEKCVCVCVGVCVWHKENTLSLIINGCNFDQGGAQALHTRARMNLIVVFNFIHSLIVFILETEGGVRAP